MAIALGAPRKSATQLDNLSVNTTLDATDLRARKIYWALFVLINLVLILPLWMTKYPPLVDYTNHLARAYILHNYDQVETFKASYVKVVEPIPNLAFDLIVPFFMNIFRIEVAGKIFLTLTLLLFTSGCHMLGRAIHGSPTWLALSSALFTYNSTFIIGFVNYMFGLGMFFISAALWLRFRRRWSPMTVAIMILLVFACFLAHLSSYLFLGVTLVVVTLFDYFAARKINKNMVVGLLPLVPPLLAFVAYMKGSGQVGNIESNTVLGKLIGALALILSYHYFLDAALALALLALALSLYFKAKNAQVKWAMIAVGTIFAILYMVFPKTLFTAGGADARFVPPAVVLIVLAISFEVSKRVGQYALIIFLAVSFIRTGSIWYEWRNLDKRFAEQVELFRHFEEGARVYPLYFKDTIHNNKLDRPFDHVILYSVIYRHASTPTLFHIRGQQPLLFRNEPYFIPLKSSTLPAQVNWQQIFSNYDYIWCYKISDDFLPYLKENGELIAANDDTMIYRAHKQ